MSTTVSILQYVHARFGLSTQSLFLFSYFFSYFAVGSSDNYFGCVVVVDSDLGKKKKKRPKKKQFGSRTHGHRSWLTGEKESSLSDSGAAGSH